MVKGGTDIYGRCLVRAAEAEERSAEEDDSDFSQQAHALPAVRFGCLTHELSGERFAVQLQARRRAGFSILHDVPAAGLAAATACSPATPRREIQRRSTDGRVRLSPSSLLLGQQTYQHENQTGPRQKGDRRDDQPDLIAESMLDEPPRDCE
jgi:hypothetical protein